MLKQTIVSLVAGITLLLFSCSPGNKDIEGNTLKGVMVKDQIWMDRNLDVVHFRNGDPIPEVKSKEEWVKYGEEGKAACCIMLDDPGNSRKYGRLYNWWAVSDPRGLAPEGWHIPGDREWSLLIENMGGSVSAAMLMRVVASDQEGKNQTTRGFEGLPAGLRRADGDFHGFNSNAYWWTSTESFTGKSYSRVLSYPDCTIEYTNSDKFCGLSVRCVRD